MVNLIYTCIYIIYTKINNKGVKTLQLFMNTGPSGTSICPVRCVLSGFPVRPPRGARW